MRLCAGIAGLALASPAGTLTQEPLGAGKRRHVTMARTDDQPLLEPGFYNRSRRRQDVAWGVLYALSLAAVVVGGVYAWTHR